MKKLFFFLCALVWSATINAATWNVTVPDGTKACYIAGNFSEWSFKEMTKVDETHYTITIETDLTDGYKYCCGPGWSYEELTAEGGNVVNRMYAEQDVVAKWRTVYNPGVEITYVDITIRVNAVEAPTIWWWGAGDKCPGTGELTDADGNLYTWSTQPSMTPVRGAANWYEWNLKDVNASLGVTFKLNQIDKEINAKESTCYTVLGNVTTCPEISEPTYTDITIRVQADAAPTIWWWGAGDRCPGADQDYIFEAQPAMKAVAGQEGWFEWIFKDVDTYTGVSFRLNSQTKEITARESACYNLSGTRLFCPIDEIDPENSDTVFFVNNKKWENVKIHYWQFLNDTKTEKITTAWPGESTQKADYRLKGADVYYYVLPAGFVGQCIFNDGNDHSYLVRDDYQTPELDWTPGMYCYNDTWRTYADLLAVYTDITVRVKADAAPAIWWWGAGDGCPDAEQNYTEAPKMNPVDGVEGWFEWIFTDVDEELGVSFRLNGSEKEITTYESACYNLDGRLTYCPGDEIDPAKSDTVFFVNADNWETVKIHYWGGAASTVWPGEDMQKADYVLKGMEVYYYTVPKGTEITYCMFHCNSESAVCKTEDLDWTVGMYYYKGEWATREQVEIVPEVLLCGTMNKWAGTAFVPAEDRVTASVVVALEKQEYQLKIKVDGAWMGNAGTMTRIDSKDWLFDTNVNYNALLDADVAGDYQFVWTYADNTLSVVYPTIAPTAVLSAENADNAALKIVRNGQVWIVRGGAIYNIMGQEIK